MGEAHQCHPEAHGIGGGNNIEGIERSQEVEGFGSWMTVQRRNKIRKVTQHQKDKEAETTKGSYGRNKDQQGITERASGSRFEMLGENIEEESPTVPSPASLGVKSTGYSNGSGVTKKNMDTRRRKNSLGKGAANGSLSPNANQGEKQMKNHPTGREGKSPENHNSNYREAIIIGKANASTKGNQNTATKGNWDPHSRGGNVLKPMPFSKSTPTSNPINIEVRKPPDPRFIYKENILSVVEEERRHAQGSKESMVLDDISNIVDGPGPNDKI